jgi:hypothetical protein
MEPEQTATPVATSNALQEIVASVERFCSPDRKKLLEPILGKLIANPKVPASTSKSKHGAFDGGLIEHINMVLSLSLDIARVTCLAVANRADSKEIDLTCVTPLIGESIVTVAVIHDINKVCDAAGNVIYVENILTKGNRSDAKPWKTNDKEETFLSLAAALGDSATSVFLNSQSIQYPSGLVSLALAEQWSPGIVASLSEDEKQAIVWHAGLYEKGNKVGFSGNESFLQIVLHAADMLASRSGI